MYNPINAYNLIKRTQVWFSQLKRHFQKLDIAVRPKITDAHTGAAIGLSDIQEFYNIDPMDIIQGTEAFLDHFSVLPSKKSLEICFEFFALNKLLVLYKKVCNEMATTLPTKKPVWGITYVCYTLDGYFIAYLRIY